VFNRSHGECPTVFVLKLMNPPPAPSTVSLFIPVPAYLLLLRVVGFCFEAVDGTLPSHHHSQHRLIFGSSICRSRSTQNSSGSGIGSRPVHQTHGVAFILRLLIRSRMNPMRRGLVVMTPSGNSKAPHKGSLADLKSAITNPSMAACSDRNFRGEVQQFVLIRAN